MSGTITINNLSANHVLDYNVFINITIDKN